MKLRNLLLSVVCLFFSINTFAQISDEIKLKSFEQVWSTINEKHFDPTFGGVDWKQVGEIYKPKALQAKTDDELIGVLQQMLGELKLSHFSVFPRSATPESTGSQKGSIGIEIKFIENQPVVSKVAADSSAEKGGVKTGFILNEINGKSITEIFKPLRESYLKRKISERLKLLYLEGTLTGLIDGKPNSEVKISFLNAENKAFEVNLVRQPKTVEYSEPLGNVPAAEVYFEAKTLENNIGYIYFNQWRIPQMSKIRQAVSQMKNTVGIVIDLRGNPGGLGALASNFAGLLCKEQTSLGTTNSRDSESKYIVYPQKEIYQGKVVILTDYGSASTSELFAVGLQEIGRAKIVGETTAGAVLPSFFVNLPNGAIFQYAVEGYKSPKNVVIENRGVIPDVEVFQTRQALLENIDLPLQTAINLIKKGN